MSRTDQYLVYLCVSAVVRSILVYVCFAIVTIKDQQMAAIVQFPVVSHSSSAVNYEGGRWVGGGIICIMVSI